MLTRSRLLAVLVAVAVASPGVGAGAARAETPAASSGGPAKAKAKKTKRAGSKKKRASTRARRRIKPNMPPGWSWPPSKAMIAQGDACVRKLEAAEVAWKKSRREGKIATAIKVPAMGLGGIKLVPTFRKPPFTMDCHLALGLSQHLPALHQLGVREIHFSSIYRNTPVRTGGTVKRVLSRHALGLAIDIRAFVDADGRKAEVLTDYPKGDELLLAVEQALSDSGGFRTVLTPRNDPKSHYDHFHVEARVEYPKSPPRKRKPAS